MKSNPVIVGLGEILWDVFPDGPRFGGAPANFACSAAGLGVNLFEVHMASAVGQDELGGKALDALLEHHVNVDAVTRVNRPTGQVHVQIDGQGHASYEFAADTAWDHLPWSDHLEQLAMASAFKLNDAELPVVAKLLHLDGTDEDVLQQIMKRYSLRIIALTRGANGSLLLSDSGERSELPGQPVSVVDTVGAGDSFTAALALGWLIGLPLDKINQWAGDVAAFVCTQPGATPLLPKGIRLPEK